MSPRRFPLPTRRASPHLLLLWAAAISSLPAFAASPPVGTPPVIPVQPPVAYCAPLSGAACNNVWWVENCGALYGSMSQTDTANNPCLKSTPGTLSISDQWRKDWSGTNQDGGQTERVFNASIDDFTASMPPPTSSGMQTYDGGTTTWASHEQAASFAAFQAVNPNPFVYQRAASSSAVNTPIDSCENYVYRSFYDVERWVDALNACKDDARCKVSVSLNGMGTLNGPAIPGIARRVLSDNEKAPIAGARMNQMYAQGDIKQREGDPFSDAYKLTSVPKNGFYAGTSQFFTPALVNAFADAGVGGFVSDLFDEVSRGSNLYSIGSTPKTNGGWFSDDNGIHQGFVDEWEFHQVMSQRTSTLTAGEAREYRRRNAAMFEAFDQGTDGLKCIFATAMFVGGCNHKTINALGKVNPGDTQMWENDPIAARAIVASISPFAFTFPPSLQNAVGFGSALQWSAVSAADVTNGLVSSGALQLGNSVHLPGLTQFKSPPGAPPPPPAQPATGDGLISTTPPVLVLWADNVPHVDASTGIVKGNLKWAVEQTWTVNPPRLDLSSRNGPRLDCRTPALIGTRSVSTVAPLIEDSTYHTEKVWAQVCRLTNVLLVEWARKVRGIPSCLDRHSSRCDWSPEDFVDRFVTRNIGYGSAAKEVEYKYCKRWSGGGKLSDTETTAQGKLIRGVALADRQSLPLLRAALDKRKADFEVQLAKVPVQRVDDFGTTKEDSSHIGGSVFGGGYAYKLSWHAKAFQRFAANSPNAGQICRMGGSALAQFTATATLFSFKCKIVDAFATVSSNEDDLGKALGQARLYVVGYEFFDTGTDPVDLSGTTTDPDPGHALPFSTMGGEKVQILKLPFQAGPVTVTVTAGISYSYGSVLRFETGAPGAGSCTIDAPIYKVSAMFTPHAELGVWADADASLAGVVGVGLEVQLTLVGLALPLTAEVHIGPNPNNGNMLAIIFNAGLDLELTTMKGEIDFYVEALWMKVASFKVVSWPGYVAKFPVFRTPPVALDLAMLNTPVQPPDSDYTVNAASPTSSENL